VTCFDAEDGSAREEDACGDAAAVATSPFVTSFSLLSARYAAPHVQ